MQKFQKPKLAITRTVSRKGFNGAFDNFESEYGAPEQKLAQWPSLIVVLV